jgi:hypothetical protein
LFLRAKFVILCVAAEIFLQIDKKNVKLRILVSFVKCLPWFANEMPVRCLTNDRGWKEK